MYDSGEASGTSINIKDSTLAEFQKITIDGVCEQVTTNGYNLLQNINYYNWNNNTGATQEKIDDYIKVIMPEDVSIYSGIYAANMLTQITNLVGQKLVYSFYAKADANRELLVQVPLLNTHNRVNLTTQWQRFSFIYEGAANQSPTFYCGEDLSTSTYYIKDIMLEVGTELHDYEPYTGLQPSPSLSYPQPIEVIDEGFEVVSCAKNRLIFEPYSFSSQGIKTEFDGNKFKIKGTASSNWAFLSPTILSNLEIGTYTLSKYKETPFQIMLILENEEKRVMTKYLGKPATEVDFSLNEKATKITLGIDNITADDEIDVEIEVQVEKGSTSTEYEAPISSRVPINLPDGKFIGKLPNGPEDQVRIAFNEEKGEYKPKLSKKLGKVVFNGREDWDLAERTESNNGVFYLENFLTTYGAVRGDCLSNYATYTNGFSAEVGQFDIHYGQIRFYAPSNSMTKEEWKEKLSTNNIEVYYPLAEPYEVDLGVIDMPLSYSPETNIFTTHELEPNINAKYYRNFINTIQNLQVNEKALQQELIDINSRLSALETNLVNMASVEEVESEVVE